MKTIRYLPDAIDTRYKNGDSTLRFLHKDHLGSVATITDANGAVVEKSGFTVWGKRYSIPRTQWNVNSTAAGVLTPIAEITTKGFTGHEHIEHADIIHMNGRIYDPTLGRFLQADPHIQAPKNSQNFNRYSYVLNNPLSYTDPSGYFFASIFKGVNKFVKKHWRTIVAIGIAWWNPGAFLFDSIWAASAATGFISGAVSTGSLKGALIGAFSGAAFGGLHGVDPSFGKTLLHGAVGGIGSVLSDGKFGHGFLSAGLTQGLSGKINGISTKLGRIVASSIVGGTVSRLTGGKFANGAITAAFSRALNDEGSSKSNPGESVWDAAQEAMDNDGVELFSIKAKIEVAIQEGRTKVVLGGVEYDIISGDTNVIGPSSSTTLIDAKKVKLALKVDSQGVTGVEGVYQPISGGPEFQINESGFHVSQDIYLGPQTTGNLTITPTSPVTVLQKLGSYTKGLISALEQKVTDQNTGKVN